MSVTTIGPATIHVGDCVDSLRTMPAGSVHCCVTSPPYWGLRDYGHDGQIGLEETPEAYVAKMVEVFCEVRRVLREDGTLWLNLGDSYASSGIRGGHGASAIVGNTKSGCQGRAPTPPGLKPKDLVGIPWRVAFALQTDGWYLRQDIIWHKPNSMPESVTDRCTKSHEYIFLMAKSERYYYDAEAVKEESVCEESYRPRTPRNADKHVDDPFFRTRVGDHVNGKTYPTRNRRSVWTVATRPYRGSHFATFPPALIEPCILAGCPVGGTVLDPFGGSGTTAAVAVKHGRRAVLCELNPQYVDLAAERINKAIAESPLFSETTK